MNVLKFGGSSVRNKNAIEQVAKIVENTEKPVFVVVSALGGITDILVEIVELLEQKKSNIAAKKIRQVFTRHYKLARELETSPQITDFVKKLETSLLNIFSAIEILGEITPKSKDMIFSLGESLSSLLISEFISKNASKAAFVDPREIIKTDSNYTEAEVDFELSKLKLEEISKIFTEVDVAVTGGFVGSNSTGRVTTLGRGGSDYSAAVIASLLNADKLEIWTDVNGILTSDPRIIKGALLIKSISYKEASELAFFGAKVLHPKTIYPAVSSNIPVYVKNTFRPEIAGTTILENSARHMIKAIAFRKGVTVININSNRMLGTYGFLSQVFEIFKKYETSVDIVTTSEVDISLTIESNDNLNKISEELSRFSKLRISEDKAIISVVGEGIRDTAGIAARFFGVLEGVNISMVSIGASEVNLSIVVEENEAAKAVQLLHDEFFTEITEPDVFEKIPD